MAESLILALSIAALWIGAGYLVEGATRLAKRLGISELIIGLTVVAFGTSAPEFAVSIGAALKGQSDISIGNVVGSNIFNLGFILGGVALLRPIHTSRALIRRDGAILIGVTILLLAFFRDLALARWEGLVLMGCLAAYLGLLFLRGEAPEEDLPQGRFHRMDLARLAGGLALVIVGGHFLVDAAVGLARAFGVSEWLIALTIVGAGTSAPEMATSLAAAVKGRHGISAGNLIGSDIFNMLGVLGLAGAIHPLVLNPNSYLSLIVMSASVILVVVFLRTGRLLTRWEGAALLAISLGRWAFDALR
jgi:cation:H+ antiporter